MQSPGHSLWPGKAQDSPAGLRAAGWPARTPSQVSFPKCVVPTQGLGICRLWEDREHRERGVCAASYVGY